MIRCLSILLMITYGAQGLESESVQQIPWHGKDFFFVSRGAPVATLFKDMGAHYRIPVIVSERVQDIFVGRVQNQSPEEILQRLSSLYHLAWYDDSHALYIYKSSEITSEVITPAYLSTARIESYLKDIKALGKGSCQLIHVKGVKAFEIVGVPACVQKVTELAKTLDVKASAQDKSRQIVRVFPLKYASATDSLYNYRENQVVIPGIVSILKEMASSQTTVLGENDVPNVASDTATFSADPRQNAVIINDKASNMPIYRALLPKLDVQQTQIQVSATIVDVSVDNLHELGINWKVAKTLSGDALNIQSNLTQPIGAFTSLIYDTGSFMLDLRALETVSKAKILSRPSVITLNNLQAVLDRNVTFYTKLQAQDAVELKAISSGTLLRVTPRMINTAKGQEVLLVLNIQDGGQSESAPTVDGLPQVTNSEISTQATLGSGQSLLLGGFVQDTTAESVEKVPLLGDIPLIGRLFQSTSYEDRRLVRLFLISAIPVQSSVGRGG